MGKNHSTNRERSHFARKRHMEGVCSQAETKRRGAAARRFYRLFWSGSVKTFSDVKLIMNGKDRTQAKAAALRDAKEGA